MERLDRLKIKGEKNVSLKEVSQDGLGPSIVFDYDGVHIIYNSKWKYDSFP